MATLDERTKDIEALEGRVVELRRSLEPVGIVLRGTVVERWMPCGKRGCVCQADPPRLHGPYLQWTTKAGGKTRTLRLTKDEAAAYRTWIENGRKLNAIIEEWEQLGQKAAELIRAK